MDSTEIDHHLRATDANIHRVWDNSLPAVLRIHPGDTVRFECRDATNNYLDRESTPQAILEKPAGGHPLTGPVAIDGASPGDTLSIELLEFTHEGIGFTYFYPAAAEKGLLSEAFCEPALHVWNLDDDIGHFVKGIEVPLDPFPGNLGVAPESTGEHSTVPPRAVGGNLDVKHLTAGSTLFLPVEVDDALFSIGDCHAAQGDGEVCVTGIEAPMTVTARFDLATDLSVDHPEFKTAGPFTPQGLDEPMYVTAGIADDLMVATELAVEHMINHLTANRGLTPAEAYMLCSVAVDLKINEVVDAPNWVVSAYLADSLFPS